MYILARVLRVCSSLRRFRLCSSLRASFAPAQAVGQGSYLPRRSLLWRLLRREGRSSQRRLPWLRHCERSLRLPRPQAREAISPGARCPGDCFVAKDAPRKDGWLGCVIASVLCACPGRRPGKQSPPARVALEIASSRRTLLAKTAALAVSLRAFFAPAQAAGQGSNLPRCALLWRSLRCEGRSS
jgi:hypothetical protein